MDHYRDGLSIELLVARLQAERMGGCSTCGTLSKLATELHIQGKYDEAEPLLYAKDDLAAAEPPYREALQTRRETLGSRHPDTLSFF